MNQYNLIGRLVRNVELRKTATNKSVVNIVIAAQNKNGADFIPCIAWNKNAENIAQYLSKGRLVAITGKLQTTRNEYKGKTEYKTEVLINTIDFLDRKKSSDDQIDHNISDTLDINDDDLPF